MRGGFASTVSLAAVCAVIPLCAQPPGFEVAAIRPGNDPPFMVTDPDSGQAC